MGKKKGSTKEKNPDEIAVSTGSKYNAQEDLVEEAEDALLSPDIMSASGDDQAFEMFNQTKEDQTHSEQRPHDVTKKLEVDSRLKQCSTSHEVTVHKYCEDKSIIEIYSQKDVSDQKTSIEQQVTEKNGRNKIKKKKKKKS